MKKQLINYLLKVIFSAALLFTSQQILAQIRGKVTSDTGEPIPGVTVIEKGTSNGTVTNVEGEYQIEIQNRENALLVFSFIGLETREIPVNGKTVIDVVLKESSTDIDEVVVVGYGEQTKKTMTGAIEAISGENIVKSASVPDLNASVAGRIPGMTIQVRDGELGSENVQMLVRGQSTMNNASPLILVDNVERPMSQVDPYDVESISVLKDASATAIFGVRGANGVILITTKRGKTGKAQITANINQSWQFVTRRPQPLGAIEFMTLRNQVIEQNNQLLGINDPLPFGPEVFEAYQNNTFPEVYFDTNYAEEYLNDFVPLTRATVNIRGGSDKVKYFTSIGYMDQGGPFNTDGNTGAYDYDNDQRLNRLNYRANFDIQVNKTLKAWMNLSGFLQDKNDPVINGFSAGNTFDSNYFTMMALFTDAPAIAFGTGEYAYENNDVVGVIDAIRTPYGNLNRTGYATRTTNTFQTSIGLEQDLGILTPGLSARALVSYDGTFNSSRGYRAYYNIVAPVIDDSGSEPVVKYLQGSNNEQDLVASLSQNSFWTSDIQLSLNYKRDFGPHATTGQFMYLQSQRTVGAQVPFNYVGLVGRATYGFDNRYLTEVNFGMNGSEQFAKGRRFGFFPSFSLGWVMSEEAFMENQRIVDFLKIRGSYGQVGNDRLGGDRFLYLGSYQQNNGGSDPSNFFTTLPGLQGFPDPVYEQVLANESVTWEVANKTNIGFEANVIGGFSLDVDLFYEKRSSILINNTGTPGVLYGPVPLPPVNAGVMENRGFEATLGWSKMWKNGLRVNTSVVASFARNKVLDVKEIPLDEDFAYPLRTEGYSRGVLFGYESLGYFTSQEEIDGWANQDFLGSRSAPGDLKYQDLNGDGFINEQDQRPM